MTTLSLCPILNGVQLLDNSGNMLDGGKVAFYEGSSFSVLQNIYEDGSIVPLLNPVTLTSTGRLPVGVYLDASLVYNVVLYLADGLTVIGKWNNITSTSVNSLHATTADVATTANTADVATTANTADVATTANTADVATTANSLSTTGASVVVSTAVPPAPGQVLTSITPTSADWKTPISASYFDPIDGTADTTDRVLGVGQSKFINVSAATSVPLYVACGDGQEYEIEAFNQAMSGTSASAYLLPNNTSYGSVMYTVSMYGGDALPSSSDIVTSGFYLSVQALYSVKSIVSVRTLVKRVLSIGRSTNLTSSDYVSVVESHWGDSTTLWSSLGTIYFGVTWTGRINIRRIA